MHLWPDKKYFIFISTDSLRSKITATPQTHNTLAPTNKSKTLAEMQKSMRGQWHYLYKHLPHLKIRLKWVAPLRALPNLPMWNFCRRMWHAFSLALKWDPIWWIWLKVKLRNRMPLHISVLISVLLFFLQLVGKKCNSTLLTCFLTQGDSASARFSEVCTHCFSSFFKESGRLQGNCSPSIRALQLLTAKKTQSRCLKRIPCFCFKLKHFHSQRDCFDLDVEATFLLFLI